MLTDTTAVVRADRRDGMQFCDAYGAATGKQWTQPIGFKHANLEVAIDILKRTKKLVLTRISATAPCSLSILRPILS
jgi:hypothetical protein